MAPSLHGARLSPVGDRFLVGLTEMPWPPLTFFMVPAVVLRDTSVRGAFAESGRTFSETWGEPVEVNLGVSEVFYLTTFFTVIVVLVFGPSIAPRSMAVSFVDLMLLSLGIILGAFLIEQTVASVAKTALYRYATEGELPDAFRGIDLPRVFPAEEG